MRTLYFDCFAGASGNMILGALFGLGIDRRELSAEIAKLGLSGYEIVPAKVDRSGISSIHVEVKVPAESGHRHLRHIREIIEASDLSDRVRSRSIDMFTRLAAAEAKVHGIDIENVHFHEVGAMDAIIDVVGACIGFEMLGIEQFACSRIHVGSGFVQMEHGKFPVPPPAVAELLNGKPIYSTDITGELVTPTGAAIIATVCDSYGVLPDIKGENISYGAGTRNYDGFPNVLRLIVGKSSAINRAAPRASGIIDDLILLETNIDDLAPQVLGYVMERSFELGALDCWFTPIQMKKNRPATSVSILCAPDKREKLSQLLFCETTTLGIRVQAIERESLEREFTNVSTEFGEVAIKLGRYRGRIVNVMPEYDDVVRLATASGVPFRAVWEAALASAGDKRAAGV